MPNFSFRVRFNRSPANTINIDASRWELQSVGAGPAIVLCCHPEETAVKDSTIWVFKSEGWPSEDLAAEAANKYISALLVTLARLRIGADFGSRAPKSGFFLPGLAKLEEQSGYRVLNDVHGLMLYESEPLPRFAKYDGIGLRGVSQSHFEQVFHRAVEQFEVLTEKEKLALDLFNSSFFQKTVDTRFVVLVMAVEALLDPSPRSALAIAHVKSMINATQQSESLNPVEKTSLLGSLEWLKRESISQAGRCLAANRLGTRRYMDKEAATFFTYCYSIRSRLVHGDKPLPTQDEVGSVVGQFEVFVSDLLSGSLRDMVLL